jgi:hypothetical protein
LSLVEYDMVPLLWHTKSMGLYINLISNQMAMMQLRLIYFKQYVLKLK